MENGRHLTQVEQIELITKLQAENERQEQEIERLRDALELMPDIIHMALAVSRRRSTLDKIYTAKEKVEKLLKASDE